MTNKRTKPDWSAEESRLRATFPSLSLCLGHDGSKAVAGVLKVLPDIGYTVDLRIPFRYPDVEPHLVCNRREIPWKLDRHVYEQNGTACLCARMETRRHWPWGSDLTDFIHVLVAPFFLWQHYFDTHGTPPPTGARNHGRPGILEAAREMLSPLGDVTDEQIRGFLRLLARTNDPAGHEPCPCGNGLKLRHCHAEWLRSLRSQVDPRHAGADLSEAFGTPPPTSVWQENRPWPNRRRRQLV